MEMHASRERDPHPLASCPVLEDCPTWKRGLTPEQVAGIDSYASLRCVIRSETSALETLFIPRERRLG